MRLTCLIPVGRGEVKVAVDPKLHKTQYPKILTKADATGKIRSRPHDPKQEPTNRYVAATGRPTLAQHMAYGSTTQRYGFSPYGSLGYYKINDNE